jgi:hypothetical protein
MTTWLVHPLRKLHAVWLGEEFKVTDTEMCVFPPEQIAGLGVGLGEMLGCPVVGLEVVLGEMDGCDMVEGCGCEGVEDVLV